MQYKYFTSDYIFINGQFVAEKVVVTDLEGTIVDILNIKDVDDSLIYKVNGALIPGLINTHCHLELSHMKGKVNTGTSLLPFLNSVVSFRNIDQAIIDQAIIDADREMYDNGIVAVGDISNKVDTASVKAKSKMDYYTFVENFDFLQDSMATTTFLQYKTVFDQQSNEGNNKKSMVPHAPYTVSKSLLEKIKLFNPDQCTISIHNQETPEENKLFFDKTGQFIDFYKGFGFDLSQFEAIGKSSIHYLLDQLNAKNKIILVHNTTAQVKDINAAHDKFAQLFWASCPNANLFIENRLPNYQNFLDTQAKVTLGTDSLTSNWQLSILEEVMTIQKFCSYISLETCLQWATANGAEALGYEDRLGSIAVSKKPGLLAIDAINIGGKFILNSSRVDRLL